MKKEKKCQWALKKRMDCQGIISLSTVNSWCLYVVQEKLIHYGAMHSLGVQLSDGLQLFLLYGLQIALTFSILNNSNNLGALNWFSSCRLKKKISQENTIQKK